jgi:hypothetical protein
MESKNTKGTEVTKHIAQLTRKDGWGVKCWHCDFEVRNTKGLSKFEAKELADRHMAENR